MSLPPIRILQDRFTTRAVFRYSSRENAIARNRRQCFEISMRDAPSQHKVAKRSGAEVKSWHCSPRPSRTVAQCQQLPTLTSKTIGPLPEHRRLDPTERISGRFWVARWCRAEQAIHVTVGTSKWRPARAERRGAGMSRHMFRPLSQFSHNALPRRLAPRDRFGNERRIAKQVASLLSRFPNATYRRAVS